VNYQDQIDTQWLNSIRLAFLGGANEIQLRCLQNLSETEFGYRSNMRLRKDCFWGTKLDRDGDVVLTFIEPYTLTDTGSLPGRRVNVYVDHLGIVTTKDLDTEVTDIFDPHSETDGLLWIFPDHLLKPFTEPSIKIDGPRCEHTETRQVFEPFLRAEMIKCTVAGDGPVRGFARVMNQLVHFHQVHDDYVSGERLYALSSLSMFEKLKVHLHRLFPIFDFDYLCARPPLGYAVLG
jgi:hypothetical protein